MSEFLPILRLDYNRWRCGENDDAYPGVVSLGTGQTMLMQKQGGPHSCCCLGLMLEAAGFPAHLLTDTLAPCHVPYHPQQPPVDGLPDAAVELMNHLLETTVGGSSLVDQAIRINSTAEQAMRINDGVKAEDRSDLPDYRSLTISERMARLTKLFADAGVASIVWVNVPDDVGETVETAHAEVFELPQVAGAMQCSNAEFERRCLVYLALEQDKISPDNGLIALLCDGVRLVREYTRAMNGK